MKRPITFTALASVVLITACSTGGSSGGGKAVLDFWNGHTASDGEVMKEIIKRYNETNEDNIEIKVDIMPWDTFFQKLPPAIATDTAPALVDFGTGRIAEYVKSGSIMSLDDFWSETGLNESDYDPNVLELGKYDGKYYMLPLQYNGIYLYWNKTLFKEAGLDPEKPPETWEQLAEYAVKLTDPSKNQYGLGLPIKTAPQYFVPLIWSNGGEVADVEEKKSLLNSPEVIASMAMLQDLAVNKQVTPKAATGPDLDNLMTSGQIAMYINGPWLVSGLRDGGIDFGITAPPAGTVTQANMIAGTYFALPSSTSESDKKAAYKFIKHWMSAEITKEWSMRNGFPPFHKDAIEDPEVKADPVLSSISAPSKVSKALLPGYAGAANINSDALWPMIEELFIGGATPEDAVRKASDKIDEILRTVE